MRRFRQIATLLALGVFWTAAAPGQGAPVTLQRLTEALDSKLLGEKEIAEIVLEVGVSFRLTEEIEKDLRRRKASDLVILAVRNGYRSPFPEGPATVETICTALGNGVSSADVLAHVENAGVGGLFEATARERLESAGASKVLQKIVAERWLQANALDGSLEQIEALLTAGADEAAVAAKLGGAPLGFAPDREAFSRLAAAGAGPALSQAVAVSSLVGYQAPLTLDQLVALEGVGVEPETLTQRILELGTDFETAGDAAERMRAAGLSAVSSDAVLARRVRAAKDPMTIEALVRASQSGVSAAELAEAVKRRGVQFTLTSEAAESLAALPAEVRKACLVQSLGQQGYRGFLLPRAPSFNATAVSGSIDIRLNIDHVEDVVIADDLLFVKNLRGSPSVDDGSQIEQPLPMDLDPNTFAIEQKDGRGEIAPYWIPEKKNGFILRARIFDEKGGSDRYHMRMSWRRGGANAGGSRREAPTLRQP
jgi:hypothetical protein